MEHGFQPLGNSVGQNRCESQGFALPLAMGIGLVLLTMSVTMILVSQRGQTSAWQRRESSVSLASAEGGMARTVAQLKDDNNAILLTQDYDLINPNTGTTYLGPDGVPQSGDEGSTAIDNWTGYSVPARSFCGRTAEALIPTINLNGTIGSNGQYRLLAYRYNRQQQEGTLLVEGRQGDTSSFVIMTVSVELESNGFPGVLAEYAAIIRGRTISGSNGNLYYLAAHSADPNLSGSADPGDADRSSYLNAVYSTALDGPAGDRIDGSITACGISLNSLSIPAEADAVTSMTSITGDMTLSTANSPYHINHIDLDGNDTVLVDTTAGPVTLLVSDTLTLRNNAQLRNIRTDGLAPRVGDLRIYIHDPVDSTPSLELFDQSCVDTAFIFNTEADLHLEGTGDGCPSNGNSNVDGVIWVEDVVSSINIAPYTRPHGEDDDIGTTSGATSGIIVPSNVSSLADLAMDLGVITSYKMGYIKTWQRFQL